MPLRLADGVSPLVFRSTEYVESDSSPEGSYYLDRGQIARRIQVDWPDRAQAIRDFAGEVVLSNNGTAQYLERTLPHSFPGKSWMVVQSVPKEEPMALRGNDWIDGEGVAQYDCCELTLVYVMPTFKLKTDEEVWSGAADEWESLPDEGYALEQGFAYSRYVTKTVKFHAKTLVLNKGMLKKNVGGQMKLVVEGLPYPNPGGEVMYTWHQVPEGGIPENAIKGYANSVNDAAFDGFPAGTLLYDGNVEIRANPNPVTGQVLYDVTYRFPISIKVHPVTGTVYGHNYIWEAVQHDFGGAEGVQTVLFPVPVYTNDGTAVAGNQPFRTKPFRSFFRPDLL